MLTEERLAQVHEHPLCIFNDSNSRMQQIRM